MTMARARRLHRMRLSAAPGMGRRGAGASTVVRRGRKGGDCATMSTATASVQQLKAAKVNLPAHQCNPLCAPISRQEDVRVVPGAAMQQAAARSAARCAGAAAQPPIGSLALQPGLVLLCLPCLLLLQQLRSLTEHSGPQRLAPGLVRLPPSSPGPPAEAQLELALEALQTLPLRGNQPFQSRRHNRAFKVLQALPLCSGHPVQTRQPTRVLGDVQARSCLCCSPARSKRPHRLLEVLQTLHGRRGCSCGRRIKPHGSSSNHRDWQPKQRRLPRGRHRPWGRGTGHCESQ